MNPSINKLFYDDGNVLVIPLYCVFKKHQEKINEKRKSFGNMGLWAFARALTMQRFDADIHFENDLQTSSYRFYVLKTER